MIFVIVHELKFKMELSCFYDNLYYSCIADVKMTFFSELNDNCCKYILTIVNTVMK